MHYQSPSKIGPKHARLLTGLSYARIEQIAELSAAEIDRIEDHLQMKGRIEREDWVGQARELTSVRALSSLRERLTARSMRLGAVGAPAFAATRG